MKEKVSVIIPVYNGEKTLKMCLSSVLNQTYKNYEVIVVDNNSTDRTKEIIQHFKNEDSRIRYVFEPKKGRGAARNAGVRAAIGVIISMTDSDCIVPENWIEEITQPIRKGEEAAVMGFEKGIIGNYWTESIQEITQAHVQRSIYGKYVNCLDTKNFSIKTSLIKQLMFNPELKALEDYELFLRLKKHCKIRFLPEVLVKHYHKTSLLKVAKVNFERGYWIKKIYEKYKDKKKQEDIPFSSFSLLNNLTFPIFLLSNVIRKPKRAFFIAVWDTAWRLGTLWAFVSK
jgi:glycosyltransferase involved in cell wall biosynthesis